MYSVSFRQKEQAFKWGELKMCDHDYELKWYKALVEEGTPINLYQCRKCKDITMDTEEHMFSVGEK